MKSAAGALVSGDLACEFAGVSIDTRTLAAGDLFIAIRGEHFDGADFAQAAIYGVGAYVTALLALHITHDLLISFLLASIAGVAVSLVVALPSLRLKNEYFLIATMGFQAIIFSLFMNLEITGGASGLYGIPHPTLFGYTIRTSFENAYEPFAAIDLLDRCVDE